MWQASQKWIKIVTKQTDGLHKSAGIYFILGQHSKPKTSRLTEDIARWRLFQPTTSWEMTQQKGFRWWDGFETNLYLLPLLSIKAHYYKGGYSDQLHAMLWSGSTISTQESRAMHRDNDLCHQHTICLTMFWHNFFFLLLWKSLWCL